MLIVCVLTQGGSNINVALWAWIHWADTADSAFRRLLFYPSWLLANSHACPKVLWTFHLDFFHSLWINWLSQVGELWAVKCCVVHSHSLLIFWRGGGEFEGLAIYLPGSRLDLPWSCLPGRYITINITLHYFPGHYITTLLPGHYITLLTSLHYLFAQALHYLQLLGGDCSELLTTGVGENHQQIWGIGTLNNYEVLVP